MAHSQARQKSPNCGFGAEVIELRLAASLAESRWLFVRLFPKGLRLDLRSGGVASTLYVESAERQSLSAREAAKPQSELQH
jgi:hypothetical protein